VAWAFCVFACLSAGFIVAQDVAATEELSKNTKDLFFDQLKTPKKAQNAGISYWIELRRKGTKSSVAENTVFCSGDKIRLHVTSNIDGYAQVALKKGSSGKSSVLFPRQGESSKIQAGKEFCLPSVGFLEFDHKPGTEILAIAIAPDLVELKDLLTPSEEEYENREREGKPKDIFYSAPVPSHANHHKIAGTKTSQQRRMMLRGKKSTSAQRKGLKNSDVSIIVSEGSTNLSTELVLKHK